MKIKLYLLLLLLLTVLPAAAQQTSLQGVVVDAGNGLPVSGAVVTLPNSGASVTTGPNGDFHITGVTSSGDMRLTVTANGYKLYADDINVLSNAVNDLGEIRLTTSEKYAQYDEDLLALEESQILDEEGNEQSVVMLTSSSDDIFYSSANYDFSIMRFRIRGYDNEYSQMFINGVQFTDAVRGRFNYSTLGGLNQAFKNRSVGLGLSSTSFSLGEIGGASNINTMAKDYAPGFRGTVSYTNSSYNTRAMITYSTGLNDHGWAFTLSAVGRLGTEGVVEGTSYYSAGLFLSLQKVFNDQHSLGITLFGAPTQRATSSATYEEAYQLAGTYMYNPNWGWYEGEKRSARIVESFDPTAIINWIWTPKTGTSLNTGLAIRASNYSSSALNWYNAADPRPDYYRYLPSYFKDNQEAFDLYTYLWQNDESQRQIDWYDLYRTNQLSKMHADQTGEDYRGSTYIIENRHSNQKNIYFNSTLNHRLTDFLTFQGGVGFNYTKATYYKTIRDLLGGEYWTDTDPFADRDFPDNENLLQNDLNNPNRKVGVGDKFGYNYDINSIIGNLWLQNTVNLDHWDINYGAKISYTQYQRDGKMRNGRAEKIDENGVHTNNSYGKGKTHRFVNAAGKIGITYKLDGRNFFTGNLLYGSRAPLADNAYISPRIKDDVIINLGNERILSADLSYTFNYSRFRGTITGFWTNMYNGTERSSFYDDNFSTFTNYVLTGVNKTYKGVEVGMAFKILPDLTLTAAGTFSRYQYKNRPIGTRSFENGSRADTTQIVYLKNYYVGGTPQSAVNVGLDYVAPGLWFININGTWLGDSYIDLSPIRHEMIPALVGFCETPEQYAEKVREIATQEKLRDAFVLNASIGKVLYINRKLSMNFNISVNNILNKKNIATGGYQQSRLDTDNYDMGKYPNRYYYTQGIRIFANVGIRF